MAPSASVNVPTNTKIKEQDVNNKLQLYGIFSGKSRSMRRHLFTFHSRC